MTTTLITGANKGLGYEAARQLTGAGHTVYVGARDPNRGRAAAERIGARFVEIDVTSDASVTAAATAIEADGGLDVLVNNAGAAERRTDGGFVPTAADTADSVRTLFETKAFPGIRINAVGPGFTATGLNSHTRLSSILRMYR